MDFLFKVMMNERKLDDLKNIILFLTKTGIYTVLSIEDRGCLLTFQSVFKGSQFTNPSSEFPVTKK